MTAGGEAEGGPVAVVRIGAQEGAEVWSPTASPAPTASTSSTGEAELETPTARRCIRRATHWARTVGSVGLPAEFHFHDLRHTGNQLAAEAGATTKELMRRMGHSTVRAAMRYQH